MSRGFKGIHDAFKQACREDAAGQEVLRAAESASIAKRHAQEWRDLAAKEREKLTWDPYLLPQIAESRAKLYEDTARAILKSDETGIPHCACHLKPYSECAQIKRR